MDDYVHLAPCTALMDDYVHLAQLVERKTFNLVVAGSSPAVDKE